jgi:riboflavin biosynthesis pyrimidine reductase
VLYSNFVASIDGVVTLPGASAGSVISGKHAGDRFLMALLRACADAVVLGAGTLRATPGHLWTPAHVYPTLAESFAGLRRSLGRSAEPRLVVISGKGDIDASHPAIKHGATIVTTSAAARLLALRLPETCEVVVPSPSREGVGAAGVDLPAAMDELRDRGLFVLLTEGGPHLMGRLIDHHLLDEAFITISPVVAGRDKEPRLGMVQGVELLPDAGLWTRLLSARRHGDHLFLRYGLRPS